MTLELSASQAFLGTIGIASVALCISALEWIWLTVSGRESLLFSWEINRTRNKFISPGSRIGDSLTLVYLPRVFALICALHVLAALMLLLSTDVESPSFRFGAPLALLTFFPFYFRTQYGHDGADQMCLLILICSTVVAIWPDDLLVISFVSIFLAAQLIVAYLASGIGKLIKLEWRTGSALAVLLNTSTFGWPRLCRILLKHPVIATIGAWTVILFELSFMLVLVLPNEWAIFFLLVGILFHAFNAFVMGLNTFFWAFISTYPSLLYFRNVVDSMI